MSRRPKLRVITEPTPLDPPTDNHLDVIAEDLATIRGMVTETRAEAAVCDAAGIEDVREALDELDESAGYAAEQVVQAKGRNP